MLQSLEMISLYMQCRPLSCSNGIRNSILTIVLTGISTDSESIGNESAFFIFPIISIKESAVVAVKSPEPSDPGPFSFHPAILCAHITSSDVQATSTLPATSLNSAI